MKTQTAHAHVTVAPVMRENGGRLVLISCGVVVGAAVYRFFGFYSTIALCLFLDIVAFFWIKAEGRSYRKKLKSFRERLAANRSGRKVFIPLSDVVPLGYVRTYDTDGWHRQMEAVQKNVDLRRRGKDS